MSNAVTLFAALADETRLRIMLLLQRMELAVGELAIVIDQSQPRISRHVRILVEAGLAEKRKEGSWVFLRPAQPSHADHLSGQLAATLRRADFSGDAIAKIHQDDINRLEEIRKMREEQASQYFAQHAQNWDKIRSLHIAEAEIEERLLALFSGKDLGRLLDIGTGTGRMVDLLSSFASHNIGLDKSPEMLRFARTKLQHLSPSQLELMQGDFNALPLDNAVADTIILHQVLHFAHLPEKVIAEAGRVAAPNAQILVVDFAPHALENLRESNAHIRLGFSDEQMRNYFENAGFALENSEAMSGGELTVKIWHGLYHSENGHDASQQGQDNTEKRKAAA